MDRSGEGLQCKIRGVKNDLSHAQIGFLERFYSHFLTNNADPFHMRVLGGGVDLKTKSFQGLFGTVPLELNFVIELRTSMHILQPRILKIDLVHIHPFYKHYLHPVDRHYFLSRQQNLGRMILMLIE